MAFQNEKELWRGGVGCKWDVRPLDYLVCLCFIFAFGVHIYLVSIILSNQIKVPVFGWLFMCLIAIFYSYAIFGRFVIRYFNLKSTVYIITSARVIEKYDFPRKCERVTFFEDFSELKVNVSFGGRYGSIFALRSKDKESLIYGMPVYFKCNRPKIRSIENFDEVVLLIQHSIKEIREKRISHPAMIPRRK